MYLVNLMEQKVSKLADSYFKEKNIPANTNMRMDIISYTLNRVQPQYVTSARGVLHSYDKGDTEENIEILTTIEKACEVIRRRKENTPLESIPLIEENGYYLTYPSIMGNICSAKNSERVESALVYMYYKNKLIEGYGANFPNPAVVSKNVPGKFMFCFMPKKIDSNESINIDLDIVIEAENYKQYKSVLNFEISPSFYNANDMPLFSIEEVDDILLIEN